MCISSIARQARASLGVRVRRRTQSFASQEVLLLCILKPKVVAAQHLIPNLSLRDLGKLGSPLGHFMDFLYWVYEDHSQEYF